MALDIGEPPPSEPPKSNSGMDFQPLWGLAASCWTSGPDDRPYARDIVDTLGSLESMSTPSPFTPKEDDDHDPRNPSDQMGNYQL
ncbi:hypothetical protein FRB94_007373 [Tulasnella sp. JGI-2019a]|nr:hypothetical protein FRB94_007373 [Tulasnella sp. JGI-2019a]